MIDYTRWIYVYKIINDINEKLYIGVTDRTVHSRWVQHAAAARRGQQHPLYDAMREIGIEHFSIEPLEKHSERFAAEHREQALIHGLATVHPYGYNKHVPLTDEQVAIIRYNFYHWPIAQYAQHFGISGASDALSLIQLTNT